MSLSLHFSFYKCNFRFVHKDLLRLTFECVSLSMSTTKLGAIIWLCFSYVHELTNEVFVDGYKCSQDVYDISFPFFFFKWLLKIQVGFYCLIFFANVSCNLLCFSFIPAMMLKVGWLLLVLLSITTTFDICLANTK